MTIRDNAGRQVGLDGGVLRVRQLAEEEVVEAVRRRVDGGHDFPG